MLPNWIVAMRTTHHSSTRQPKRVRPDWIKEHYRTQNLQRIGAGVPKAPIVHNTRLIPGRTGPLNLNEYRFWRASNGQGRCRCCLKEIATPKERIEHQKTEGCTRTLVEAYKLLLKDMRCVVCDTKTTLTKWGIPLCNTMCMYRWQFETGAGSYPVQMAIQLYQNLTGNAAAK